MYAKLPRAIKKAFKAILEWDLSTKSQVVLIYATLIELGLYYLQIKYLYHPIINTEFLLKFLWFLPTLLTLNFILFGVGFLIGKNSRWGYSYAFFVGLFYSISLMMLPIVVGILNIANGVIFVGTTILSLVLFPRKIVYPAVIACGLVYVVAALLTVTGHMNYALALKPHVLIHPDIEHIYILASMFYTVLYTVLTIYLFDICLQSWKEKELLTEKQSCTDALTDILNRRGINEIIHLQLQQALIANKETALVILDIDDFKKINDQYGHIQGDQVLKHVAKILKDSLRGSDIVGRYGGEEFILLLPFTTLQNAVSVAEICRTALENHPIETKDGQKIIVKASFGVSSTVTSHFDFEALLDQADQALYIAKKKGKNQVQLASI